MNNLVGTRLGKYEIQAEIGHGGMGAVYRGYDPLLDRYVAVKVLAPHLVWEKGFVERFLREARAAARLKHPNIVTIYDVGQEGGSYYFVMEYLEGQTLTEVIRQQGPLPPDEVLSILQPLAEALDYAHYQGLVHRDIKPGNIIVGPGGQATLTDFGIARAAQETRLTGTGTLVGTPQYMSPEQVKGLTVDGRSDLYSLAVLAYEMLRGQAPFQAEITPALLYKVVHELPPPIRQARPDLPAEVEGVLAKALAKEPGERYATVSAFVDTLGRALAGEEVEGIVARPEVPAWMWALAGVAVLALVMGVVMAVGGGERPVPGTTLTAVVAVAQATSMPRPTTAPEDASTTDSSLEPYLVFASDRSGKREVYRLTRAGEVVRVTHTLGNGESWWSALAPDGTLYFTSDRSGKREVYRLTGAGETMRVTHTPGNGESWSPALAPDGTLYFTSDRDGKQEVYHLTGAGETVQVTHTLGNGESWSPVLASDGTLYFTSDRDGEREVYRLTRAGEAVRVTHTPGNAGSWSPALAPDGTLYFTSDRDRKREVCRLTEAGEVVRVTHTPGNGESWSSVLVPDGTPYFTSDRDGKREVYRLTGAGEAVRVIHTAGNGESWLPAW
jgi:Tol biopolymer transport system component